MVVVQSFQLIANRFNDEVDFDLLRSLFAPNRFLFSWAQKSSDVGRGDYLAG